jgi:hypothetical protein
VTVHSLALAPDLVLQIPHSHVHAHVVFHPLLEVRVQVDRSSGIVMVVGIACYSVLIHQFIFIPQSPKKKEWTYSEEYVVESCLGCKTVGVLLGLGLDDGCLGSGYDSYDVVGDCSSLVLDHPGRAFREVKARVADVRLDCT